MIKNLLFVIGVGLSLNSVAQYCATGGPTQTIDSNVESVSLIGAIGSISYTGCPAVIGLEDQTAMTTTLNANSSYTANIQFGTCGNNFAGSGEAWIDYNANQIFEASESIGTWSGTPPVALSNFMFTVPSNAINGATRMRVVQSENSTPPLDPCASFSWGSMVDFTIIIQGGTGTLSFCEGGPTSNADSNISSVSLIGSSGTPINFTGTCPGILGVEQSSESTNLGQGNSFQADINFGTCGGNFGSNGEAWIDYNQNYIFEPSESIGTWTGTGPGLANFQFTVPVGAPLGTTKMRVMQAEQSTLPMDPCADFTWGSVVDFNVTIEAGIDCSGFPGDDFADAIEVTTLPYIHNHQSNICYTNQNLVYASPDVFYLVIPNANTAELEVSLCNSSFDTHLSVFDTQGNVIAINDDHPDCGTASKLDVSVLNHDSVYVVVEGWNNSSGIYELTINTETVGLDNLVNDRFELYPNPASQSFTIDTELEGTYSIMDMGGRILQSAPIHGNKIDVANYKAGVYLILLETELGTVTKKLSIK